MFTDFRPDQSRRIGRRQLLASTAAAGLAFSQMPGSIAARSQPAPQPFDIFTGIAPSELIIPRIIPEVYAFVSPVANDATLVLRITTLVTQAWFDAIAPYHPTAVGISSKIPRQPESEATILNKNIATLFASHRVLASLLPRQIAAWDDMLHSAATPPHPSTRSRPTRCWRLPQT